MSRLLTFFALLALCLVPLLAQQDKPDASVLPTGDDGKPLNLDFETGTLKDWTATGAAFKDQPIKGDTVAKRRADMKSNHQGDYWIGGFEKHGDKGRGTLTSVAFKVTHPYASFLIGGGPHATTRVELVLKDSDNVFHRASGLETEDMRREVIDLRDYKDKYIFIRLVDNHSGHWGHLNFDDFRFHKNKPTFPQRPRPKPPDSYKHAGLSPQDAAKAMTVPDGFKVTLFAGEPEVKQPIALCIDDRGRVWVAEAYSYPVRRQDKDAKDRILIFEDTDGDGVFDKRTVFMENLNLVSGLEVGFGGLWIGAAPYLMYVPMKDDKPSGPTQILLDGWGHEDTHETLNAFIWGPDGWLYGCHGVFTHSRVGKPETPNDQRIAINAGIWRYHPTRHVFEVFAHGTSNPWGLDFDDYGQAFVEACVIPHNWHIIQGGRYHRQAATHFNPFTYDDIKTIAKHRHYVDGPNVWAVNDRSDSAGGGHAHCGTMIYLGGTWPIEYRNKMFMGNIHGKRLNVDVLRQKGSGYEADRNPDFLLANDAWARFINLRYGPDGNVYLIDWYDKQACHHRDPKITDRENGRIYKISHKGAKWQNVDLSKASDEELAKHQTNNNDWYVRHARRLLQERGGKSTHEALHKIAFENKDAARRLRGLWALHATGGLTAERVQSALKDEHEYVRGWAIQLALEESKSPFALMKISLVEMATKDPSAVVRRFIASALQRLPIEDRWDILERLVAHKEDATDHNLPLLYWYAAEPLAAVDAGRAMSLAAKAKTPTLLPYMTRRVSSSGGTAKTLSVVVAQLGKTSDVADQRAMLKAMQDALAGQRNLKAPEGWDAVSSKLANDAEVRNRVVALGVVFGDQRAFAVLRKTLGDEQADGEMRRQALTSLVEARDAEVVPLLQTLSKNTSLRLDAIRGLASFDDPKTPTLLLSVYPSLDLAGKRAVVNTLASRVGYGKSLLDAVAKKAVPAADVSADVVRNLLNLGDKGLEKQIADVWGIVRTTPKERAALIKQTRGMLLAPPKQTPDVALGRAIYQKTCAQCHTLFGTGGKIGPDVTGANRDNLDYLLENVLDPSAVITKEYAVSVLTLNSGRKVTGIVRDENDKTLTIVTTEQPLTIPTKDIDTREPSTLSMMPDDLLKGLNEHDVRSLFAYLRSPTQTPLLATADNAKDLYNGVDLTGWQGNLKLWSVDKGEIVGKTSGLKKNAFLRSEMLASDFKLTLKVKLMPNKENSGIQFRSEPLADDDVKGPQADVGAGWWGKLYEEHGRGLLWKESGEKHVKVDDWNEYVIEAVGGKVKTWINGKLCVDLEDAQLSRRGVFAFQLHSGGAMEVRFKDVKLDVIVGQK